MLLCTRLFAIRNINSPQILASLAFKSCSRRNPVNWKTSNKVAGMSWTRFNENDFVADDAEEDLYHEDGPSVENPKQIKEEIRKEEKRLKKITLKTVEKKHFKAPQEVNLLTWDAKEQIRYLHQEFPEEWTADRLAESFPISKEGVQKLLKSKFVPRTEEEVLKHDRKVKLRWKAVEADTAQGPVSHRFVNLKFAAGNKALPLPKSHLIEGPPARNSELSPGKYASIVKDYVERRDKNHTSSEVKEQPLRVASDRARLYKTLPVADRWKRITSDKRVTSKVLGTSAHGDDTQLPHPLQSSTNHALSERINYRRLFKYKQRELHESAGKQNVQSFRGSLLDAIQESQRKSEVALAKKKEMTLSNTVQNSERELDNLPEKVQSNQYELSDDEYNSVQHRKYNVSNTMIQEELPFMKEACDYEDLNLQKINSSKLLRDKEHRPYLYKRNNCYYDEDGEFLFKT